MRPRICLVVTRLNAVHLSNVLAMLLLVIVRRRRLVTSSKQIMSVSWAFPKLVDAISTFLHTGHYLTWSRAFRELRKSRCRAPARGVLCC